MEPTTTVQRSLLKCWVRPHVQRMAVMFLEHRTTRTECVNGSVHWHTYCGNTHSITDGIRCSVLRCLNEQSLIFHVKQENHALAGLGGGDRIEAVAVALVLAPPGGEHHGTAAVISHDGTSQRNARETTPFL